MLVYFIKEIALDIRGQANIIMMTSVPTLSKKSSKTKAIMNKDKVSYTVHQTDLRDNCKIFQQETIEYISF